MRECGTEIINLICSLCESLAKFVVVNTIVSLLDFHNVLRVGEIVTFWGLFLFQRHPFSSSEKFHSLVTTQYLSFFPALVF